MRVWLLTALGAGVAWAATAADVSYSREVRPILQRHCQGCHQPNVKSSDLDLTSYEGLAKGGKGAVPFTRAPRSRVSFWLI